MAAQIEMVDMPNPEPDRSSRHANSEVAVARSYPGNQNESEGGRRKRQRELQWFDISCLIINKVIGSGIFISPALVVLLTGSKWAALLMWIFGSLYSFASILIYLEYGLAWPFNGGEFVYISKILPRPSLVFACSYAWFFTFFSTSAGNAISFARFVGFVFRPDRELSEWLQKFIACWIVVGICLIHYRLVNIGIGINNFLAAFKTLNVLIYVLIGLVGGLSKEHGSKQGIPGGHDFHDLKAVIRAPANSATAILLVLYSYQGWENANYVTAEIKGENEIKRRTLKKGALIAVTVISVLYIFLNFVMFWFLSLDEILEQQTFPLVYNLVLKSISNKHLVGTKRAVSVTVALSALGNLTGVIFTNGRVKREIASSQIIPFWRFFSMSSKHGLSQEDIGTPSGGLILHGLISCIFITATPLLPNSLEGYTFILNTFTYGHSILSLTLAFGILFPLVRFRMNANQTAKIDQRLLYHSLDSWDWLILKIWPMRWLCAGFLVLVNSLIIMLPFIPAPNPDGTPRKIPTWTLPAATIAVYIAGALAGLVIVFISTQMSFLNSTIDEAGTYPHGHSVRTERVRLNSLDWNWISPKFRRWEIEYPEFGTYLQSIRDRGGFSAVLTKTEQRLFREGEAATARVINQATGGNQHFEQVWVIYREWLSSRWRRTTGDSPPDE